MQISAVILTKNEEKNIKRCIESLLWCNEIIIIDDYSEDKTLREIKNFKARVYRRHLNSNFAQQRNFGLSKANSDWVLFLDADEIITLELKREILDVNFQTDDYNGFYIKRRDYFMGRQLKYGETGNIKLLRLGKKNAGKWKRSVHETWEIKERVGELKNTIHHYPHQTIREFIDDINFYSTIHAQENKKTKFANIFYIITYPLGKFFVNYFLKLGFLDGGEGIVMAIFMSLHSFLAWGQLSLSS